jgi:hypothetical protein
MGIGIVCACFGGVAACSAERSDSEGDEALVGTAQSALVVCLEGGSCPSGYHVTNYLSVPECPGVCTGPGGCAVYNAINCEKGQ